MPAQRILSGFGMTGRNLMSASLWSGRASGPACRYRREAVARGERVAQASRSELAAQGDDAVVDDRAEAVLAVRHIACELHPSQLH